MIRYCLPLALCFAFCFTAGESLAQRVPNYNRRPTVSPYVNLFNNNQGGVNNYFSFVRPMQQQARFNQQQLNENRFFERQFAQPMRPGMQGGMMSAGVPSGMFRPGSQGVGQPSSAATYFNYSHFYAMPRVGRRR